MDNPQPNNPTIKLSNNPTPNTPMPEQSNNQQPSKPIRKQPKESEQHLSSRQQNVEFGLHFSHIFLQRLTLGGVREGPGTSLGPMWPHTPKNHKTITLEDIILRHILGTLSYFCGNCFCVVFEALPCALLNTTLTPLGVFGMPLGTI